MELQEIKSLVKNLNRDFGLEIAFPIRVAEEKINDKNYGVYRAPATRAKNNKEEVFGPGLIVLPIGENHKLSTILHEYAHHLREYESFRDRKHFERMHDKRFFELCVDVTIWAKDAYRLKAHMHEVMGCFDNKTQLKVLRKYLDTQ